jgi:hypothetical protein
LLAEPSVETSGPVFEHKQGTLLPPCLQSKVRIVATSSSDFTTDHTLGQRVRIRSRDGEAPPRSARRATFPKEVGAVVSRGGGRDLAGDCCGSVRSLTPLIVGMNRKARTKHRGRRTPTLPPQDAEELNNFGRSGGVDRTSASAVISGGKLSAPSVLSFFVDCDELVEISRFTDVVGWTLVDEYLCTSLLKERRS